MDENNNIQLEENEGEQNLPSKPKNKIGLLIIVLIIFILLVGVIFYFYFSKNSNIVQQRIQGKIDNLQVETLGNLTEKNVDILSEPAKQKILKDKQNYCDTISGEKKEECLETVKSLQVTFLEDEELCEQLNIQKDQCFKNLAINKGDISICQRVEGKYLKEFCEDIITQKQALESNDISSCGAISDNMQKEMCIENIINYEYDIELCDSEVIINNNMQDKCQSIILFNKATMEGNPDLCDDIPLADYQEECIASVEDLMEE